MDENIVCTAFFIWLIYKIRYVVIVISQKIL